MHSIKCKKSLIVKIKIENKIKNNYCWKHAGSYLFSRQPWFSHFFSFSHFEKVGQKGLKSVITKVVLLKTTMIFPHFHIFSASVATKSQNKMLRSRTIIVESAQNKSCFSDFHISFHFHILRKCVNKVWNWLLHHNRYSKQTEFAQWFTPWTVFIF